MLFKREKETRALNDVASRLGRGEGSMTLIEGPAGIGKTSLLARAESIYRAAGYQVRSARAGVLERQMPYGIVRQLLEPLIERADDDERGRLLGGPARLSLVAFGRTREGRGARSLRADPRPVLAARQSRRSSAVCALGRRRPVGRHGIAPMARLRRAPRT